MAARAAVVATVLLVAVIAAGIWIGASEAAKHAVSGLIRAEEESALEEARGDMGQPVRAPLLLSMGITSARPISDGFCTAYEVTAYTFFGRVASTMETECSAGSRRTS
jgi:hypothetical protein